MFLGMYILAEYEYIQRKRYTQRERDRHTEKETDTETESVRNWNRLK